MKKLSALLILIASLIFTPHANAQEEAYAVDYNFEFYVKEHSPDVDVKLDIILTNKRSDVYITEYAIRFPQNFFFKNLHVTQEGKEVPFVVSEQNSMKALTFTFDEPESGSFSQNRLELNYTLENMHNQKGRINEMILPLLISEPKSTVNATLHLPDDFERKISIAKPVPTQVDFRQIHWKKVSARTIFVVFGESQVYDVTLGYSLKNRGLRDATETIALPPETLFQKVYIDALKPAPNRTYTDEDGNFLAEYTVPSRSTMDIQFDGYVEVYVKPQSTLRDHMRSSFASQQNTLLTEQPLWELGRHLDTSDIKKLHSIDDIFSYVIKTLDYSIARLNQAQETPRFGAQKALDNPQDALCTEYTDLFIGLAREKGIQAREIQGYGYSESQRIRPQSLILDELHAWPEYYDRQQEVWVQVDPTWADTSGIDYFTGFDMNHIALAIHGKDPQKPLPAGFYKTAARKDVSIKVSSIRPSPDIHLDVSSNIAENLTVGKTYTSQVMITNTGNSFVHEMNIIPEAAHLTFSAGQLSVQYLAPYETKIVPITFTVQEKYTPEDTVSFTYDGVVLGSYDVHIQKSQSSMMKYSLIAGGILVGLFTAYLIAHKPR